MAKKKRHAKRVVPRKGPPVNLRPAGAHEDETKYDRKRQKTALRREAESGFVTTEDLGLPAEFADR